MRSRILIQTEIDTVPVAVRSEERLRSLSQAAQLRRKCRTIGNECRVFAILIGADQKPVTPVGLDGYKIEVISLLDACRTQERGECTPRAVSLRPLLRGADFLTTHCSKFG